MDNETVLKIILICIVCFVINLPFGMFRSRVQSYSILWFLSIHAPIPIAVIVRKSANLSWYYIFIFIVFSIAGQIIGKKFALKYFPPKWYLTNFKIIYIKINSCI